MSKSMSRPICPHLTSPIDEEAQEFLSCPPTPPLRKSIYPHPTNSSWHVNVVPYSDTWPTQFDSIATHLDTIFTCSDPPVPYLTIEHIGSTSIPTLAAKPNIDVLVTFASYAFFHAGIEALNWEIPSSPPFARYTQVPKGGGIQGRESFKLYLPEDNPYYASTPERSVYLIADMQENPAGKVQIQCYRTVRDTLRKPENRDLLEEYAEVKIRLAKEVFQNGVEYSARKDATVRKILLRAGWTAHEVDVKEELSRREWNVEGDEAY